MSPSSWTIATLVSGSPAWQEPLRDTVLMVEAYSNLAAATQWSLLALIALASFTAVGLLGFMWRASRLARRLEGILARAEKQTGRVFDRVARIADNVDAITRSVRGDVQRLTGSVRALSDRLAQASEHMEARIDEFNALLQVVQSEAEEVFLDTASAVRGVRAGARALDPGREAAGSAPTAADVSEDGSPGEEPATLIARPAAHPGQEPSGEAGGQAG